MSSNNQENYEQLGSVSVSNIFSLLNKELFSYLKIGKLPNIRISVPLGSIPSRERSHKLQRPSRQVDNSDLLEIIESPLSVSQRKHSIASKFQFLIDTLEMEKYIHQNKLKTSSSNINNNNINDKGNDEKLIVLLVTIKAITRVASVRKTRAFLTASFLIMRVTA
eukprot:TRINITY_DN48_c0_g2_i7.p2 TRINITY_DN48_c0_g2~~TRINITY_DN48_c0_g2_i7.p2  ORF type:complete len:165 (+),score=26.43 TRINITY_DN48_c0_g2_i7:140-634(+)